MEGIMLIKKNHLLLFTIVLILFIGFVSANDVSNDTNINVPEDTVKNTEYDSNNINGVLSENKLRKQDNIKQEIKTSTDNNYSENNYTKKNSSISFNYKQSGNVIKFNHKVLLEDTNETIRDGVEIININDDDEFTVNCSETFYYKATKLGVNNITFKYLGNESVNPVTLTTTFNVSKVNAGISIQNSLNKIIVLLYYIYRFLSIKKESFPSPFTTIFVM